MRADHVLADVREEDFLLTAIAQEEGLLVDVDPLTLPYAAFALKTTYCLL